MVANVIEDHVITLVALGEILFRVINDAIGADRSDKIEIACATNSRDLCAKRLGDLHGEGSYTSGRAVDQNLLPGLNLSLAQALQRGKSGQRNRGGLLKRNVQRLDDQGSFGSNCILGQRAPTDAEHFVARFELRDVLADRFHLAGNVTAEPRVSWFAQSENQAIKPCVADHVRIQRVEGSRPNFNQDLVIVWTRFLNVIKLPDIG